MSLPINQFDNFGSTANQAARQNVRGDFVQNNNTFHYHVLSTVDRLWRQPSICDSQTSTIATGLLLKVLPAFISAAGHRKEKLQKQENWIRKWEFALQYEEELVQLRLSLLGYIREIVNKTTLSPELQIALCNRLEDDPWESPEVAKQVYAVIGTNCQPYLELMMRLCTMLAKQVNSPASDVPSNEGPIARLRYFHWQCVAKRTEHELTRKQWTAVNFSLNSSERVMILNELRACNQSLLKLYKPIEIAEQRSQVEPTEDLANIARATRNIHKRRNENAHTAFERRQVVQKLFEILQNSCKCVPSATQDVGLRLQVFASNNLADAVSTFQMLLFLSPDTICELSAKITRNNLKDPANKRVRFMDSGQTTKDSMTLSDCTNLKRLEEICDEVSHALASAASLDLFVDEREEIYFTSQPHTSGASTQLASQHVISLAETMSKLRLYSQKRWLQKEKSILAITLAYSQLHLHDSPWLQLRWSSDIISFIDVGLMDQEQSHTSIQSQLRKPYTRTRPKSTSTTDAPRSSAQRVPPRKCAHLRALGVVLLELFLNDSIHNVTTQEDKGSNYVEALDILMDHADDATMTHEYYEAVRFCLSPTPSPDTKLFSFEDEGFRELFYQQVILNLQRDFTLRFGESDIFWADED